MKILDLFCGAGGAAMGLHQAWPAADITGVDIRPQPRYPFRFIQADAMTFPLEGYDFIWASPPCQRYSAMSACRPGLSLAYPDLIATTRKRLLGTDAVWCMENVQEAPMAHGIWLCGSMVGLPLYRHRRFEVSHYLWQPAHTKHAIPGSRAGHWRPGTIISVAGNCAPIAQARAAMGIDWMNRDELSEAIPPAYSRFIAQQLNLQEIAA